MNASASVRSAAGIVVGSRSVRRSRRRSPTSGARACWSASATRRLDLGPLLVRQMRHDLGKLTLRPRGRCGVARTSIAGHGRFCRVDNHHPRITGAVSRKRSKLDFGHFRVGRRWFS